MLAFIGSLLVPLFFLFLYRIVRKRRVHWVIPPVLLFLTATTFAVTPAGHWVMGKLAGLLSGMGLSPAGSAALTIVLLLVGTFLDLRDKRADGVAKTGLVLIPLLAVIASGPIADAVNGVTTGVSNVGHTTISTVTGG